MKIQCKFVFKYPDPETAKKIRDSLEVDNYQFIQSILDGDKLIATIESESFPSLFHTTEDYLSCLTTAENVISQASKQINKEEAKK